MNCLSHKGILQHAYKLSQICNSISDLVSLWLLKKLKQFPSLS